MRHVVYYYSLNAAPALYAAKCFELRRFVEAQKEYVSRSIDQAAYQKMTPQEKNEADTSLGRNVGDLDDMLERAGCD